MTIYYPSDEYTGYEVRHPGSNFAGAGTKHYEIACKCIQEADICIFVMNYSNHLTHDEQKFLEEIRTVFAEQGKFYSLFVAVNRIDERYASEVEKSVCRLVDYIRSRLEGLGYRNIITTDSGETQPVIDNPDTTGGREGTSDTPDKIIDLSTLTGEYIAQDGEILTGITSGNIKITIADGAVVTFRDANISSVKAYKRPGISCEGDAAINLEGTNYVRSFAVRYPAVHVPERKTLTIMGSGSLVAEGRTSAAAIGGARDLSCGNINISGGTVEAVGGDLAGGIGGGGYGDCGNITITSGVTKVTATKGGKKIPYSIGAGNGGYCGVLIIGGVETNYIS